MQQRLTRGDRLGDYPGVRTDPDERTAPPARVLLADDDDDHRRLLSLALTKRLRGILVESVSDGQRAYRAAALSPPDLAVLDLDMPGLNGLELTSALRATPGLERLPIIVVSGRAGSLERELLARAGVDRCFDKPVALWKLAGAARELLGASAEHASDGARRLSPRARRGALDETG